VDFFSLSNREFVDVEVEKFIWPGELVVSFPIVDPDDIDALSDTSRWRLLLWFVLFCFSMVSENPLGRFLVINDIFREFWGNGKIEQSSGPFKLDSSGAFGK
jgi:hypothetical protein